MQTPYNYVFETKHVNEWNHTRPPQTQAASPWLPDVLLDLASHPGNVFRMWNWKSAVLSMILRGPIFLIASAQRGWEIAFGSLVTEAVFCAITAGFYGTLVQAIRNARPKWVTGLLITVLIPAGFQGVEYGMHWLRGTPHLKGAEIASVIVSVLSAWFNWYAMRRGALLVGGEGGTLGRDLLRMPLLILHFVISPFRWVIGKRKRPQSIGGTTATSTREDPC